MPAPKSSDILHALRRHYTGPAHSIRRFNTGLAHYVYEVMTDGDPIVVRMADSAEWNGIPGGVYWGDRLRPLGVPLPKLIGHDLAAPYPYMLLERLPGRDLGDVYPSLSPSQKKTIALQIADIQARVAALPHARWYGYLSSYEFPQEPHPTWLAVLEDGLRRAENLIRRAGIFDPEIVQRARRAAAPWEPYFASVPPAPFLDDTTTKNVLILDGALSGLVDVDVMCFGDRLDVLALTNMALLSRGWDTDYVEYWAEAWQLTAAQMRTTHLYTLLHGVYFLGEVGQAFNREEADVVDEAYAAHLREVVEGLMERMARRGDGFADLAR